MEPEKSKIQQVEKTQDIEQSIPKKKQEEDLELLKKPQKSRGFGMGMWFSIFRHKGSSARRICKGTFHSSGKKNFLCSLRSCGIFYPSPLTNTLCFAGRCLGKKKKCCSLVGVRFVILLPGFVRMVGKPHRSAKHAISFCNNQQSYFRLFLVDIAIILIKCANALKPPAKTPPEAKVKRCLGKRRLTFRHNPLYSRVSLYVLLILPA